MAVVDERAYWYEDDGATAVDLLNALRDYRSAEQAMRRRTRDSMGMNENDLAALRFLLAERGAGRDVTAKDLARRLGITPASVSVLVDRLVRSGHLERRPHPTDHRAALLVPTGHSDEEVRATLGDMHRRMMDVVTSLDPAEVQVVTAFLRRMAESLAAPAPVPA
jgi:DNA-binding MarR family transcriptional regulator